MKNTGVSPDEIVDKVMNGTGDYGYDSLKGEYVQMFDAGIIDPTKVS